MADVVSPYKEVWGKKQSEVRQAHNNLLTKVGGMQGLATYDLNQLSAEELAVVLQDPNGTAQDIIEKFKNQYRYTSGQAAADTQAAIAANEALLGTTTKVKPLTEQRSLLGVNNPLMGSGGQRGLL